MLYLRDKIKVYRMCRVICRSGLFDRDYYLRNNLDVARNCMDPVRHYVLYGWREGRNPSAVFHTRGYLEAYPDVAARQINPLYHYCQFGYAEGRLVSGDTAAGTTGHPRPTPANTRLALFAYLLGMMVKHPITTLKLLTLRRLKFMLLTLRGHHEEPCRLQVRYRDIYENYSQRTAVIRGSMQSHAQQSDIFIFPIIDWHFRIQRPQHLATHLAKLGHRVFYFTTVPKLHEDGGLYEIIEQVQERVFVCKLYADGTEQNIYRDRMVDAVVSGYRKSILALMNAMGTRASISIIHLPYWLPLVKSIPGTLVVYDCMDHHEGFYGDSAEMSSQEMQAVQDSEVVITTSEYLCRNVSRWRPTTVVRNGTDYDKFATPPPLRPAKRNQPVVGYIGAISEWFDVDLVVKAARRYKQYQFVLIGSTAGCNTAPLKKLPNIELVGEIPYAQVAGRLHEFDITMIPFKINELTKATNPVKVYEYLSAGKPIVATAMPELCLLEEYIHIGHSHDEFVNKIGAALKECGDEPLAERRRSWAKSQDWEARARAFSEAIEQSLPQVSIVILTYNNLEFTRHCLESIERNTFYPNYEVIIVDNASQDDTADYVSDYISGRPNYTLICNPENLGFSAGNNVGIRKAGGEYIVLLNNDTYVSPGWLQNLIWPMMRDKTIGLAGPVTNNIGNEARINIAYRDMREMESESFKYIQNHRGQLLRLETVAFFCVAIARRIIDEVGELDERFKTGFFEDDDYCRRVRLAGYHIVVVEDSFVHHHLSASFNQLGDQREKIFQENRKIYEEKWGSWQRHVYREESDRIHSLPGLRT
ncbi:MAG: glycosyltransferase [Anaerohalosphaeraceae bacterium]